MNGRALAIATLACILSAVGGSYYGQMQGRFALGQEVARTFEGVTSHAVAYKRSDDPTKFTRCVEQGGKWESVGGVSGDVCVLVYYPAAPVDSMAAMLTGGN